jgi:CubicO group peptidase (beta-lactamase class C family)
MTRRRFLSRLLTACATVGVLRGTRLAQADPPATRPTPLHLDPAFAKLAAEYNAVNKGISMLVMVEGKVVFEDYPNGGRPDRPHELASGTKSFCGALAVAAAQDGLLTLDEAVCQTLAEWKDDPRKSQITVRQLLSLSSGIPGGQMGQPPTYANAITVAATAEPGTRFMYGPVPFQVFGELMRRKLTPRNLGPLEYLQQRIFDPIGLKVGFWRKGGDGQPHLPSGAFLTAHNWAKYGQLICRKGRWEDKQVLDADLLEECFRPSRANPAYGMSWWLNQPVTLAQRLAMPVLNAADVQGAPGALDDLVFAAGAGKQRLYVSRKLGLVVVRQATGILEALAKGERGGFSDTAFLGLLLTGKFSLTRR